MHNARKRVDSGSHQKKYTLSGFVRNRITKEPISNLVLLIKSKNIFTTTSNKGYYSFNVPYGNIKIETILLGYKKQYTNFIIYNNGNHTFFVDESSENLDEVIIESNAKKSTRHRYIRN